MSEHVNEKKDYLILYKNSDLILCTQSNEIQQKIKAYKQNKSQKLRDEIIADTIGLVYYVANRYALFTGIDQNELQSYGKEALLIALENFDVNLGYDFSNYAIACISKKF